MKAGNLYIYVDESGSPDVFSRKGGDLLAAGLTSNHLVIAALRCDDPNQLASCIGASIQWADAKYGSGVGKTPVRVLHARDDRPALRVRVCQELSKLPLKATAIVFDKRLLDPAREWRRNRTRFYDEMVAYLLADSLHLFQRTSIIISRKNYDTAAELQTLLRAVARRWWAVFGSARPAPSAVSATQQRAHSNRGLQAVDYVAWAVFQAFERGNSTYLDALQPIIGHVWDLSRLAHYTRKNPMTKPAVTS